MGQFRQQFLVIFKKNFILGWRSRELISEIVLPIIVGLLLSVKIALSINSSTRALLIRLVEEKSERYKETQKIMGLSQSAYFMAWLISSYIRVLMSSIIFLLPAVIYHTQFTYGTGEYTPQECEFGQINCYVYVDTNFPIGFWDMYATGNVSKFFICFLIYSITAVHQSFAMSTLFSDSKLAGDIGTFITTLTTLLVFLIFSSDFADNKAFFVLISIFPQPAVGFAYISAILNIEQINGYQTLLSLWPQTKWDLDSALIQMVIMSFVYLVTYFYLEEIIPNEYGISKHPLFFLEIFKKKKQLPYRLSSDGRKNQSAIDLVSSKIRDTNEQLLPADLEDDTSSALFHEEFLNKNNLERTVIIKKLTKIFGNLRAVDGISLNLYSRNIFCLLGHNGAGKTTAISVLCGLISKSFGNVNMYGLDLENDITTIRQIIGICNQKDCLYEDMTFEENLSLIAEIKGCSGEDLKKQVNDIIQKTKTEGERKKLVRELSGGNKRKLSLGMALIADSKIVFLDEPTSGMDTISRRKIWEILETVRNEDRTIVLTTHHLEEAEVLADRIGIMAKGKLLAVGTSEFIKKNFGVGYHLTISYDSKKTTFKNFDTQKQFIIDLILGAIPNSQQNTQTSAENLVFVLPFNQQGKFSQVFGNLEQIKGVQINLEMNSLEDAFINIGMDEEKFMDNQINRKSMPLKDVRLSMENRKIDKKYEMNSFDKIKKPDCLSNPPVYRFSSQLTAIFFRKYYYTVRTFSSYLSLFIPLVLLIAGTVIINNISGLKKDLQIAFLSSFTVIAYAFNGGAYITLTVLERELKLKYALNVMGCRVVPYWLGTFLFDYLMFCFTIIVFFLVALIGQITFITDYVGELLYILLTFGFSFINWSYMWGFAFEKSNSALKGFPSLNFFVVWCIPWSVLGVWTALHQNFPSLNDVYEPLGYLLNIIFYFTSPLWCFNIGFILIPGRQKGNAMVWIFQDYWVYGLIMIGEGFFYIMMTYYLEQRVFNLKNEKMQDFEKLEEVADQNVRLEKDRVNADNFQDDKIIIQNMWKKYENGFVAIKDVSYGVKQGEIFGLLGPNGAGKSTTFNILTSLIPKSFGNVKIKNIEVNKGIMKIYQDVGICPQLDCLWQTLSPIEHLYLFGRMKGLQNNDLSESVQYFIETMQLTDFVNTKAGRLSGGNKRKLCVSNALIGSPDIQFFDEPSTGVDPIARRFLWNTLSLGSKLRNSSIVLTTHQMQEAETLCQKIGIIINGRFYCLGSPQDLRNKYGEGYIISIKSTSSDYQKAILENFQTAKELVDKRENYKQFQISLEDFSFFKAFRTCEEMKEKGIIEDFSINQSSLEQVFVYFSQFQYNQEQ